MSNCAQAAGILQGPLSAGLHIRSRVGFDMIVLAYRSTIVDTDIFFDNPKMARYVSNIDIRYDTSVPVWPECTRPSGTLAC